MVCGGFVEMAISLCRYAWSRSASRFPVEFDGAKWLAAGGGANQHRTLPSTCEILVKLVLDYWRHAVHFVFATSPTKVGRDLSEQVGVDLQRTVFRTNVESETPGSLGDRPPVSATTHSQNRGRLN